MKGPERKHHHPRKTTCDMPGGKVTVHNEHAWTLSADGKILTAVSHSRLPRIFVRAPDRGIENAEIQMADPVDERGGSVD